MSSESVTSALTAGDDCRALGRALENEGLLTKVLHCLIQDGIQECRLVCRQWRNVCRTLPVFVRAVLVRDLVEWADKFPNAESLSLCNFWYDSWNLMMPEFVMGRRPEAETSLCKSRLDDMVRFRSLKHLTLLNLRDVGCSTEMEACFRQLGQLESFAVNSWRRFYDDAVPDFACLPQCLCHLTNLTKLTWIIRTRWRPDCEPLTSLTKIEELFLSPNVFTNRNGDLMFPSLTSLSKIAFNRLHESTIKHLTEITGVLSPYGSSLRGLEIRDDSFNGSYLLSKPCIASFPLLEVLTLPVVRVDDGTDLLQCLLGLANLKGLECHWHHQGMMWNPERLSALSKLQSLTIPEIWKHELGTLDIILSKMHRLTHLSVTSTCEWENALTLKNLTTLVELSFDAGSTSGRVLIEILTPLTRLQSLMILGQCVCFPSEALAQMKNLKDLSISCKKVDVNFGATLASLPRLTCLDVCANIVDEEFLHQVNRITNLVRLELVELPVMPNFPVLDGRCLSRLRYLKIDRDLDEGLVSKVREALPCLRSLIVINFWMDSP